MSEYVVELGDPHKANDGSIECLYDQREQVVRCRDCRFFEPEFVYEERHEEVHCSEFLKEPPGCGRFKTNGVVPNGFCAWAERPYQNIPNHTLTV